MGTPGRIAVQLVRAPGLLSHAIAWWGSGWDGYSHGDILLSDGTLLGARSDRVKLKDGKSIPPGVQVRPQGYARWERRTLFWKSANASLVGAFERAARAKLGTAYDKDGILRLILGREPLDDGNDFCSCLIMTALQEVSEVGPLSLVPQQISPDSCGLVLSALKWNRQEMACD